MRDVGEAEERIIRSESSWKKVTRAMTGPAKEARQVKEEEFRNGAAAASDKSAGGRT